jgi:hypothetical protein
MHDFTTPQIAARQAGRVGRGLFVHVDALDFDDVTPHPVGVFTGVGVIQIEGRTYIGSSLVSVSALDMVADASIPGLTVTLSGIPPETVALVRGSQIEQRPIRLDFGIYDVSTGALIDGLIPRFRGVIDDAAIDTPAAGGQATITLTCESTSRAMTLRRYDTRSDESCKARHPGDRLYAYTNVQRKRVYFGGAAPE